LHEWRFKPLCKNRLGVKVHDRRPKKKNLFRLFLKKAPVGKTPIEDQSQTPGEKLNTILAIGRIGYTALRI
jgi:hypothetical protein